MTAAMGFASKAVAALRAEVSGYRPRLHAFTMLARTIPAHRGGAARAALLRLCGFRVGRGTRVDGALDLSGGAARLEANLAIGKDCRIGAGCAFELGEHLELGDGVTLGAEVLVLTTTHELGPREHRAGALVRKPVRIASGATLGARAVVLPGVTIGEGAVVAPGSVVAKDVPPGATVEGVPARPNRGAKSG